MISEDAMNSVFVLTTGFITCEVFTFRDTKWQEEQYSTSFGCVAPIGLPDSFCPTKSCRSGAEPEQSRPEPTDRYLL